MSQLLEFVRFKNIPNWSLSHFSNINLVFNKNFKSVKLKEVLSKTNIEWVVIEDNKKYPILGVHAQGQGVFINRVSLGKELTMKKYQKSKAYHLYYCKVRTVKGQWGIVYPEFENSYGSSNMQYLEINLMKLLPEYLELLLRIKKLTDIWDKNAIGADGRHFNLSTLLNLKIPLPPLEIQKEIVKNYQDKLNLALKQEQEAKNKEKEIEEYLYEELGIKILDDKVMPLLNFTTFNKLNSWSYKDIIGDFQLLSSRYETIKLNQNQYLYEDIFRGKSPKYDENSKSKILNQKCIRWNYIALEHSKKVNKNWLDNIDKKFFTQENDILINSTGDGTIGRASYITKEYENLLYDSHVLLIRVAKQEINALFVTYFLNSTVGQQQIENIKSAVATKQTELGINNFKNLQFIVPTLDIQDKIADHITKLKEEIQELKKQSIKNRDLALFEFEQEIFNEA